jgi:hypothetical protein
MQITVNIPDELAAEAQARGIPVEVYVQSLVEEAGRKSRSRVHAGHNRSSWPFFRGDGRGFAETSSIGDREVHS